MASQAKITIRVTAARGGSTVSFSSNGRYISFNTSGYQRTLMGQPIQPTSSLEAFWAAILNTVLTSITTTPAPP
jgi:hypothetical protein